MARKKWRKEYYAGVRRIQAFYDRFNYLFRDCKANTPDKLISALQEAKAHFTNMYNFIDACKYEKAKYRLKRKLASQSVWVLTDCLLRCIKYYVRFDRSDKERAYELAKEIVKINIDRNEYVDKKRINQLLDEFARKLGLKVIVEVRKLKPKEVEVKKPEVKTATVQKVEVPKAEVVRVISVKKPEKKPAFEIKPEHLLLASAILIGTGLILKE